MDLCRFGIVSSGLCVYKGMISYHVNGMGSVSFSVECFNYSFVFSNSSPKYHHPNAFLGLGAG